MDEQNSATSVLGVEKPRFTRRQVAAAALGHAVENFDWLAYSIFAGYIAAEFFPTGDTLTSLMATFATFAVGFFIRPLGGVVLGRFTDRVGRRPALMLSISMMAFGSLLIAVTPGYDAIGVFAPILLVLARAIQGFSGGGEVGAVFIYMAESAPDGKKGRQVSFVYIAVGAALLLASSLGTVMTATLGTDGVANGAWRVPFVVGAIMGLVVLVMRRALPETDEFTNATSTQRRVSFLSVVKESPGRIFAIFIYSAAASLLFYAIVSGTGVLVSATSSAVQETPSLAFTAMTVGIVVHVLLMYPFGALADRYGMIRTTVIGLVTIAVISLLIPWIPLDTVVAVFLVYILPMAALAMIASVLPAVLPPMIPAEVRGITLGIGFGFASALFGGTAPYVLTYTISVGIMPWFYIYVAALSLVAAIAISRTPRQGKDPE